MSLENGPKSVEGVGPGARKPARSPAGGAAVAAKSGYDAGTASKPSNFVKLQKFQNRLHFWQT